MENFTWLYFARWGQYFYLNFNAILNEIIIEVKSCLEI